MSVISPPAPPESRPFADLSYLDELIERLGGIPLERIRLHPLPGTATEEHVADEKGVELIDGVVVEKAMGFFEDRLGVILNHFVEGFLEDHDVGFTLGGEAPERVAPGQVRRPDFAFFRWERFPGRLLPREQILSLVADFMVEVISPSNTKKEMDRKRREYFDGGARLIWMVYPERFEVHVYNSPDHPTIVGIDGTVDGGDVLPGFALSVRRWFERAGEQPRDECRDMSPEKRRCNS